MQTNKDDIQELVGTLMQVVHLIQRNQGRGLRELGLDPTTVRVLEFLAVNGSVHPQKIAHELSLLPSSVTRCVQSLEEAGYVAVTGDPNDRRARLVSMTERGQEEIQRLTHIGIAMFAALVADWQPEEVKTLSSLLARLGGRMSAPRLSRHQLHRMFEDAQES
ncbi:MarR family transcriptional regulator [Ktedonosporobacter rubrisoli]|uniref:MarR family transcriptional regulator n=1 Tax=Ktedonosporobacter rubrisoli TaxID=2509675 RepID=A0A4P6JMF4_KTERU|nr:MarR family transcriptional regulator [Ktedonosporobacter rubrisoli]QBD75866.1 MarR family transcriptional regulator [Ktedonosporobacter rubrisoli]